MFFKFNIPQPEKVAEDAGSAFLDSHEEVERVTVIDMKELVTVKDINDIPLTEEERDKLYFKESNLGQAGLWVKIKHYKRFNN